MKFILSYTGTFQAYALILLLPLVVAGCIFVKSSSETEERKITIPSHAPIPMSEDMIRSDVGDMIAFLPQSWFFLNMKDRVPSNVFAVAVNPDYTMSLEFSALRREEALDTVVQKEGVIGLARASYMKRERKTAGTIKRYGNFEIQTVGLKKFGTYEYTCDDSATTVHVAVFRSSLGNYYEFTLAPLTFTGRPLPPKEEIVKIYQSVLSTIDY